MIEYAEKKYKRGEVRLKEEWFEMLHQWDTALQVYESSLSKCYEQVGEEKLRDLLRLQNQKEHHKKQSETKEKEIATSEEDAPENKDATEDAAEKVPDNENRNELVTVGFEEVLSSQNDFINALCGKLRCLDALGEWDRLRSCVEEIWDYCNNEERQDTATSDIISSFSSNSFSRQHSNSSVNTANNTVTVVSSSSSSADGSAATSSSMKRRPSEWTGETGIDHEVLAAIEKSSQIIQNQHNSKRKEYRTRQTIAVSTKYKSERESECNRVYGKSTVVEISMISIPPSSFKPVSLSLSRSPLF